MRGFTEEEAELHKKGLDKLFKPIKRFSEEEIQMLEETTVIELAQQLEEGLLHMKTVNENLSVYEFIKNYMCK